MIDPGTNYRLLYGGEAVRADDEWCGDGRGDHWHPARPDDVGNPHTHAQRNSTLTYGPVYRRRMTMAVMCGCGNHVIDGSSDPYEQHRAWAEDQQPGDM